MKLKSKLAGISRRYWREIAIALLVLLLVVGTGFYIESTTANHNHIAALANGYDSAYNVAKYYENKNEELVGQIKTHELTIESLTKYGEKIGFDNKNLKGKVGNLNRLLAHYQGKATAQGTFTAALKDTLETALDPSFDLIGGPTNDDPVAALTFAWSNNYLTESGEIFDRDSVRVHYQYNVDFSITGYKKPQGLFKPKAIVADIYFSDPAMKVKEFKGFVIKRKEKNFFGRSWDWIADRPLLCLAVGAVIGIKLSQ